MTTLKDFIVNELKKDFEVEVTFGYITKRNRWRLNLPKSHWSDAIAICNPKKVESPKQIIKRVCIPKGRYQLTKRVRSEKKLPGSKVFGYSIWDKVQLPDKCVGFIKGRRMRGYFVISDIDGNKIKEIKYSKLNLIQHARGEVATPHIVKTVYLN